MVNAIKEALDRLQVNYRHDSRSCDAFMSRMAIPTKIKTGTLDILIADANTNFICFNFYYDYTYNSSKKNEISECVCRANEDVLLGHFTINYDKDHPYYILTDYAHPDPDYIEFLINQVMESVITYADAIVDVDKGISTPVAAIEKIKAQWDE